MRSVVIDASAYDWEGDQPLNHPVEDAIVYEMHVRGFTQSPSSGVEHPGTFAGITEKVPYLKDLGVTAVELLPVFDFDETDVLRVVDGHLLPDYWVIALWDSSRLSPPIASAPRRATTYRVSATW